MSNLVYRPEIDGLRALAVLPVVVFHMGLGFLSGGYIGVDVFFVISGYLISLIIIKDHYNGVFSYKDFWLRRVRRIMPALLVMVCVVNVVGNSILYLPDVLDLGYKGLASTLSFANIEYWRNSGSYWGFDAQSSPFLHTWSLSLEEQFYLIFPVFLIALLTFIRTKTIFILGVLCALSFLLYVYGTQKHPTATFYLLPTRAWELGMGGMLALLTYHHAFKLKLNHANLISILGLLLIIFSYVFIAGDAGISPFLMIPVLGATLIIASAMHTENVMHKCLSSRPMVTIGKLSYSIYLWHWPILVLLREKFPFMDSWSIAAYSIPLIVLCSYLSYHYVEKRMRYHPKSIYYIMVLVSVSLIGSFMLSKTVAFEDTKSYDEITWMGGLYNVSPPTNNQSERAKRAGEIRMKGISYLKLAAADLYKQGGRLKLYGGGDPELVLLGDSHALMWAGVIDDIAKDLHISTSFYAADGTPTFFNIPVAKSQPIVSFFSPSEKIKFDEKRLYYLREWKPKLVIIAARWSGQHIQDMIPLMDELKRDGAHVLLVEDPPVLYFGDKNAPQYLAYLNLKPNGKRQYIPYSNHDQFHQGNELLHRLADKYMNCDYISIESMFKYKDKAWVLDGKDVLYIDDDHLSYKGALKAKGLLFEKINAIFSGG